MTKRNVEDMSFEEAKEHFLRKGVGVRGLETQSQLNEALNDHRHAFTLNTREQNEIEKYLLTHGYKRGDIKAPYQDVVDSRRLRSGRVKATRWLVLKSKIHNWWWHKRH